ncbi:MAG: hypothetical protein QG591_1003 [Planctomycetota bacterium]|nr:hypothetical protein [Planctomycetota bacterium]
MGSGDNGKKMPCSIAKRQDRRILQAAPYTQAVAVWFLLAWRFWAGQRYRPSR